MDAIDLKILSYLQANARISNADLARSLQMAPSGVLERVRKLEQQGVIETYSAKLNAVAVQAGLLAFIFVTTNEPPGASQAAQVLVQAPEVQEVHHIAGNDCFLVKVRVTDTSALAAFMRNTIGRISTVVSTRTSIVLEALKETSHVPLPVMGD